MKKNLLILISIFISLFSLKIVYANTEYVALSKISYHILEAADEDPSFGSSESANSSSNSSGSLSGENFTSDDGNLFNKDDGSRLNYDNICSNSNIQKAFRIIGIFINIIKVLVPLLLIVFGMLDFGKAVIASDENYINKATNSLIKRFIVSIIVFFIPTLILVFMDWIEVTKGIDSVDNENFGGCTRCLFDSNDERCK